MQPHTRTTLGGPPSNASSASYFDLKKSGLG
jgi:hypothetical protein